MSELTTPEQIARALRSEASMASRSGQMQSLERLANAVLALTEQQQQPGPVSREELIELGACAIQPAYGAATLEKAGWVVDAILARYDIYRKQEAKTNRTKPATRRLGPRFR